MTVTMPLPTPRPGRGGQPGLPHPPKPTIGAGDELADAALRGVTELSHEDADLYSLLTKEYRRQQDTLMMVAASSVALPSVLAASGTCLNNLTTEGYPGRRFYAGCEVADRIEELAIERARRVFGARYVNVQPHSGSSANLAVLTSIMAPGHTLLGLSLDCGGHLTHGSAASLSGRYFRSVGYHLTNDGRLDLDEVADLTRRHRPRVIICGASAYPRAIDFAAFRPIADSVGALLLADISHVAGLVAAGLHPNPIDAAHVVTTSTYKQLCGPRGGLIMSGHDSEGPAPDGRGTLAAFLQRAVFPFLQGTPSLGAVAAKARALDAVAGADFQTLARRLRDDARAIADRFLNAGLHLVTGGTDTHMVLVDLRPMGLTGDVVEQALERCRIVVNRNRVPGDRTPIRVTGGIRIGTNTLAVRGMGPDAAQRSADLVLEVIGHCRGGILNDDAVNRVAGQVDELCRLYPLG